MKLIRTLTLEALLQAKAGRPDASVIAGGTDLLVQAYEGGFLPDCLLDLSGNRDLRQIALEDGMLSIGAAVTFSELEASLLVQGSAPLLALAAAHVGSAQIRNRGTLGGNVANASPAADSLAPLAAHGCRVVLINAVSGVRRTMPLGEFILGPGRTALEAGEVLIELLLEPKPEGAGCAYRKIGRRNALAIARMSGACMLEVSNGVLTNVRLSLGAVLPSPRRLPMAEAVLQGCAYSPNLAKEAGEAACACVLEQTGGRASAAYKMSVVRDLVPALAGEAVRRTERQE